MYIAVKQVETDSDYNLFLTFTTGEQKRFSMKPYLDRGIFRALKELSLFHSAKVSFDTVCWGDDIDIVTVTSIDLLDNLFVLFGEEGAPLLKQTPLVVVSDRMRQNARKRGCKNVILAKGVEDQFIVEAVSMWVGTRS